MAQTRFADCSVHADQGFTEGDPANPTPVGAAATTTVIGSVLEMAHIAPLGSAPTSADFNGLLAAMQAAGMMASS